MGKRNLFSILFLAFLLISLVSAEMLVSDAGVKYDSDILEAFENNEWVDVIIDFKNISEKDVLISDSSDSEIQDIYVWESSPRIDASISEEGFNKFISDERIESIYYDFPVQASNKNVGIGLPPIPNMNNNQFEKTLFFILGFLSSLVVLFIVFLFVKLRRKKGIKLSKR